MAGAPLVSVITPTWQRRDLLLSRCVPSVEEQGYRPLEHVVVSDGPDELLAAHAWPAHVAFAQLPGHDPARHWGNAARRHALTLARGEFVAYLDDDDAYRADHVALLAAALAADPFAGVAVSRMVSHQPSGDVTVGYSALGYGQVGTPMLMHRREVLDVASWGADSACEDWDLVAAWMGAGVKFVRVDADTVDVWPSAFAGALA